MLAIQQLLGHDGGQPAQHVAPCIDHDRLHASKSIKHCRSGSGGTSFGGGLGHLRHGGSPVAIPRRAQQPSAARLDFTLAARAQHVGQLLLKRPPSAGPDSNSSLWPIRHGIHTHTFLA